MADPSFLEDNADDVLALVLTHSHEDHYGAVLDLWPAFDRPVYATAFTAAMLAAKRASDNIVDNVSVRPMQVGKPFTLGPFTIEAINVAHSIPESCALAITTPIGRVIHTGDWKLDPRPIAAPPTDEKRFRELGAEGIPIALICDSTNALKDGESPSEDEVGATLAALIADAPHRVAVTTFASNVGRVISVARAAREGRPAGGDVGPGACTGSPASRANWGCSRASRRFSTRMRSRRCRATRSWCCAPAARAKPRAAIARIARGEHPAIDLNAGDRVIFSSWAIPGNEREVIDIQNMLIDRGIEVITQRDGLVHTTGHPRREELKRLYDWVQADDAGSGPWRGGASRGACRTRPPARHSQRRPRPQWRHGPAVPGSDAVSRAKCAPASSISTATSFARPTKAA